MAKSKSKSPNDQYVEKHEDGWAVRKEGSDRATAVFETRNEAVERARELARSQGGEVYIYREGYSAKA